MSLLDVSDLSVRLGATDVVRNVSLSVERGEFVGSDRTEWGGKVDPAQSAAGPPALQR